MTPIERTRAKASALQALGLGHYAEADEIREAWRQIVFRTHPDRNADGHDEFAQAKAAYDFLRGETPADPDAPSAARPRGAGVRPVGRPSITTRTVALKPGDIDRCRALLAAGSDDDGETTLHVAADHVPERVQRHGRNLTYIVPAAMARGRNRVALPTALLEDARRVAPAILTFLSAESGAGDYHVPEGVRARHFRGARSVTIRFEGGA